MNQSAMRITWDEKDKRQIEEAKTHYIRARKEGRKIVAEDGVTRIEAFRSYLGAFIIAERELSLDEFSFRIFDETGDRRIIWNSQDPREIKEAMKLFQQYMDKGWKAYGINSRGERSRRINRFDAGSEEVIFDEKTTAQKLAKFVETHKRVDVVPRTYPG